MTTARRPGGRPIVALVGRPNVGKSTLFNRITRTRRAIVAPIAGTTRDVFSQPAEWNSRAFDLLDTGGLFGSTTDPLHELVVKHGRKGIERADLLVFLVDGREGLVPGDEEIAREIRTLGVPIILAVNKMDDKRAKGRTLEFYQFGFEPVMEITAEHGIGVGDLLDEVVARLPGGPQGRTDLLVEQTQEDRPDAAETRVAIVGRPNVGKSSLVNRLLREERVMVSERPGTTRDAVDTLLLWHKKKFRIVDTAGIRRPGRVASGGQVESISVLVARRAIQQADVAVLVIDAHEGPGDQDAAIAGEAERSGCSVIIAANKWDLMKGRGTEGAKRFDEEVRRQFKFLEYAPLLHMSALTGDRTGKLLETIDRIGAARQRRIPTPELNKFIETVTSRHPPASPGKREVRILYAAQTHVAPPKFVLFTNVATTLHFSYERFLVNQIREAFGFEGTPIRLHVRRRAKRGARRKS